MLTSVDAGAIAEEALLQLGEGGVHRGADFFPHLCEQCNLSVGTEVVDAVLYFSEGGQNLSILSDKRFECNEERFHFLFSYGGCFGVGRGHYPLQN